MRIELDKLLMVYLHKPFRMILLLAMLASTLSFVPAVSAAPKAQPMLLDMAARTPDAKVSVIVQKAARNADVEGIVSRLGGTVTKDLSIINGFAADMPARSVPELAKADWVRWVSMDSQVQTSSLPTQFTTWATQVATGAVSSGSIGFNNTPIAAGSYVWFNASFKVSGLPTTVSTTVNFNDTAIQFTTNGVSYNLDAPDSIVTFDPAATTATTNYDAVNGKWKTTVPAGLGGDIFLGAMAYQVSTALPGSINPVTWTGRFTSDTGGLTATWKWGAAVYSTLSPDYNVLGVKPCTDSHPSVYQNGDTAATPENYKSSVIAGARGGGGTNYTGGPTGGITATPVTLFDNVDAMIDAPEGPNGTYGYGSNVLAPFGGFVAEKTDDQVINRVEVVMSTYVTATVPNDIHLLMSLGGQVVKTVTVNKSAFTPFIGAANAGRIYADMTGTRVWKWSDFDNNLQVTIDQCDLPVGRYIYHDAVGLRVTTASGADATGGTDPAPDPLAPADVSKLLSTYDKTVKASNVWNEGPAYLQGQGVGVAVVDSGIFKTKDLEKRVTAHANFNPAYHSSNDGYGHGTFVAGIIAGNGKSSGGQYIGVAPKTKLINVRVSNDTGGATASDLVSGLQWVLNNKTRRNIRVVNISINSSVAQSYNTDPICAAVEVLWFNGIVVVVSAGNNGTATLFPPANDPFVITVGATDDKGTASLSDDIVASFSAYGTVNGVVKPDLVAPGTNIIAPLPQNNQLSISVNHSSNRINTNYFKMSGTSMAAPVVAGAVALLLQDEPTLTPDQVKYRLKATAISNTHTWAYSSTKAGAGMLDIYAAVHGTTTANANTNTPASQLLWTGTTPVTWGSVNWNSVNWNSVNWNSVNWNSVNWNSVNWNSDYWAP